MHTFMPHLAEELNRDQLVSSPLALTAALEKFCAHLAVRNYSPFTIEQRLTVTNALIGWLAAQDVDQVEQVTPDLVEAYRKRLFDHRKANGEGVALRTQIARLVAIRAFFRWLAKEKLIASNPAAELELPRGERRLPGTILSQQEVQAWLCLTSQHRSACAVEQSSRPCTSRASAALNCHACDCGTWIMRAGLSW